MVTTVAPGARVDVVHLDAVRRVLTLNKARAWTRP